ncbi:hypothetical protein FIM10_04760 [Sphingomonadales bacterium 56]|uniref:hypothetical protein n=1 Tax=unclassified Sphingobium TaxID=2611147 RepID=UPI00191955D0|nr:MULTISPECIES: hypothetical protein [unclassified Sphingobium]MBY2927984.1 hypothetical protein [Sphingomonadales bacterium 56]MBY2958084.1 hypothetical protein [Sphingomonadales bacterium 58]CAD7336334.1 hypothetical protein SPHS6_00962 [Sphingobium sp. S6]CAD7336395.1 hypothetical protein SPHS8_01001 [Sphingobium sp. S8]
MGAGISAGPHFRRVPDPLPVQDAIIGLGARCFRQKGLASCLLRLSGYEAMFRSVPSNYNIRRPLSRVHDIAFEDHQFPFEPGGSNVSLM